ncbi:DUF308 domain-containing protein [Leucobacter massiliensis]|uniref:DUF308 domain-containing protein n=1 Tax=Leucobacter massiliensis TaxID=1686285 RepID=A0A2S9QRJ5_9MICO|nr:DUF308 domain-containing protein [Leucobacter massiliensis]PRI12198.1 hypothetical protein B4915_03865 [Leucobacter massiliensis]
MSQEPVPYRVTQTGRFPWWTLATTGVLVGLVGLAFLVWPLFAGSWAVAILFGSALIVNGLALITRGGSAPMLGGVLLLLAGVLAIAFAELTVAALVSFVGAGLIVLGVIWIAIAARISRRRALGIVPGAVMLLGGVVALVFPGLALSIVSVVGGLCMLLLGVLIVSAAWRLRGARGTTTTIIV